MSDEPVKSELHDAAEKILRQAFDPNYGRWQLQVELDELNQKIAAATSWGAALGARHERRKEIERALDMLDREEGRPL